MLRPSTRATWKPNVTIRGRVHGSGDQRLQAGEDFRAHPFPRAQRVGRRRDDRRGIGRRAERRSRGRKRFVGVIGAFSVFAHVSGCRAYPE